MAKLFAFFIFILPYILFAQHKYSVDSIPKALKENADAVIRLDETIFTIKGIDQALEKKHFVVTILNQSGEDKFGTYIVYNDGFSNVKSLNGIKYDASGEVMAKLKRSDIQDFFPYSYDQSIQDLKVKLASFTRTGSIFPYTIEFTSEVSESNMMFYPEWTPIEYDHVGVEKASLAIISPTSLAFRLRELNMPVTAQITRDGELNTTKWTIENIDPLTEESYLSSEDLPTVLTAPINFEVEGYRGSIKNWSDVGKFYLSLIKGLDELPLQTKQKLKELTAGQTDPVKKTEVIYKYLQANTRYVSIQLGLGGWKPMPAIDVATKGYGDCKALSNYMVAMLKETGITAYPALINAGISHFQNVDFPALWFNHMVVCVPLPKDTIWLECTSQTEPMGYQGSFTGNRHALLITPEGGAMTRTTFYTSSDNLRYSKIDAVLSENGSAKAFVKTIYKGLRQDKPNGIFHELSREKQKQYLVKHLSINNFELNDFSLKDVPERLPEMVETLDLTIGQASSRSGQRIFIRPNLMSLFFSAESVESPRKAPLYLNPNIYTMQDADTVVYTLPASYRPENLPKAFMLHSRFGDYSCNYTFKEGQLTYYRNVSITGGTFPPEAYAEWIDFAKKIRKSDKTSLVFTEVK